VRRNINQKVLITSWPPPHWKPPSEDWNPERLSSWVRYTMASLGVRNYQLNQKGMREQIIHSLRKGIHRPKNKTIHHFCELVSQLSGADKEQLLKEAYEANQPYTKQ